MQKKTFLQISQNSQESNCAKDSFLIKCQITEFKLYWKRNSGTEDFLWILPNFTFFKEPFGCLLLHKHLFYFILPYHDLLSFQKRSQTYFLVEYFVGLICRLGTRVSSIFQTPSQKLFFNPVKHLWWSFFEKIVNSIKPLSIFAKKAWLRCLTRF